MQEDAEVGGHQPHRGGGALEVSPVGPVTATRPGGTQNSGEPLELPGGREESLSVVASLRGLGGTPCLAAALFSEWEQSRPPPPLRGRLRAAS